MISMMGQFPPPPPSSVSRSRSSAGTIQFAIEAAHYDNISASTMEWNVRQS